jgi:DNA-binding transcriptional MerR regulator
VRDLTYKLEDMMKAGRTTQRGVRFWEQQGLLGEVERTGNRYRRYTAEHIRRARIIAACQVCGYPLAQIARVLDSYDREALIGDMRTDIREIEALIVNLPTDDPEFDL